MADTTANTSTAGAPAEGRTTTRKQREGVVVSSKGDKTIIVEVLDQVRHRRYGKIVRRTSRIPAHDEANDAQEGDRVRITETRPLSRTKHWRLSEILERAK